MDRHDNMIPEARLAEFVAAQNRVYDQGSGGRRAGEVGLPIDNHGIPRVTAMTHIATKEQLDGKVVDWLEKVSDEQYQS